MQHTPILIDGLDLFNAYEDGTDTPDSIDRSALYEVTWPEHVTSPRFNGDCDFSQVQESDFLTQESIADHDIFSSVQTRKHFPSQLDLN